MVTDKFRLDCRIKLTPKWHSDLPEVKIFFGDQLCFWEKLSDSKTFQIEKWLEPESYFIAIEFINKTNRDTIPGTDLDKAIIIESIEFNKISSDKFIWESLYYPTYDPEWVKQQTVAPDTTLKFCNYLGWNGTWRLDFTVPIFTWIHRVENHGWIYD